MKEKAPAYQRYPKQILGDDKYLAMEWDARGMHNWLLDISWQQEPRGTIPADQGVLRRWLSSPSDETWRRVWPQISPSWPAYADGRLGNKGMLRTAEKQENYSNGNRNKGANRLQFVPQTTRKLVPKNTEDEDEVETEVVVAVKAQKPEENFNGEMWVTAILNSHPNPQWGQPVEFAVIQAIEHEARTRSWSEQQAAEFIHERTKLFAQHWDRWPDAQKSFADKIYKSAFEFFTRRIYNQDEQKCWQPREEAKPKAKFLDLKELYAKDDNA